MCFSAGVSLTVGAALLPAGVYCLFKAAKNDPAFLALAATPLVFGAQQISEGFVWRGIDQGDGNLVRMASLVFLAFALAFWPFWLPLSAARIERRPGVKRAMSYLAVAGLAFGLYLFVPVVMHGDGWLTTKIYGHSIQYDFTTFPLFHLVPGPVWQLGYIASVTVPLLLSVRGRGLRVFGAMVGVSAVVSQLAFWYAFVSVWCLFAAVLSVYLANLCRRLPRAPIPAKSLEAKLAAAIA